ncbi:MAG: lipocalin family protein [Spirochaetes bacterium]|nr:lipocalin family protein [Spirochaetota bacterium]
MTSRILSGITALALTLTLAAVGGCKGGTAGKIVGTWSYDHTESSMFSDKAISLKVFKEWIITFKADGTYEESSLMGAQTTPTAVKGTYTFKDNKIIRDKNPMPLEIISVTKDELVFSSVKNTKQFFKKK